MLVRAFGFLTVLAFAAGCDDNPATAPARDSGADAPADAATDAAADAPADAPSYDPAELLAPGEVTFPASGPRSGAAGRGRFSFGVATASAQIEDMNPNTDWWAWTLPTAMGGLGHGRAPVGDAVQGFTQAVTDVDLARDLGVDVYRMSVEWARIEPRRNVIDMEALAHYGRVIDAVRARGMRVSLTVHHFSSPVWVDDPRRRTDCAAPSDTDLCGWDHPVGGPMIAAELGEHAALLARTFGDRVDEWATVNEPVNYMLASYGQDQFPPGRNLLLGQTDRFVDAVRNYVRAHAAIYEAIKANDTVDADGDGSPAEVGMTLSVAEWMPSRQRDVSANPEDLAARDRVQYVYHYLFVDAVRNGTFDPELDGTPSETHPEWRDHLDWLGLQYYFRAGVSALPAVIPRVRANVCLPMLDLGACVVPADATHYVPVMGYEFYEPGIFHVLRDFSQRYATLPLTVTEGGIAAESGARRAENIVRSLEQIERARRMGVDVRGYYHWSLLDNFEWAYGYVPRFGLYRVDRTTTPYRRTATEGATVFGAIAHARRITPEQRARYGGLGPMTPEIMP